MSLLTSARRFLLPVIALASVLSSVLPIPALAQYDVVIANGRVMDPESGLDGVRWIGIRNGKIAAISEPDIAGFDPAPVTDRSTYQEPARPAEGFRLVLVNGVPGEKVGTLVGGAFPGKAARAIQR